MKVARVSHSSLHRQLAAWFLAGAGLMSLACNRTDPKAPSATTTAPAATAPGAPPPAVPNAAAAAPAANPETPRLYGAPLTGDKPIEVAALMANPESFRDRPVTVAGQVRKACTRKGCWMELASSTKDGAPGCRVTFKDYGFFVPTDSAGSRARVQGTVVVDTLPAASVRHYEEEGAVFPGKKADGTAPEVRLVATGVELWRERQN